MSQQTDGLVIRETAPASRYLWRWGWKRPLGPGQFRLGGLLALVTVPGVVLGLWKNWYDQQAPYRALRDLGATLTFYEQCGDIHVDLSGATVTDKQLVKLCDVPDQMDLDLSGTTVTDRAIDSLIRIPKLANIDLSGTNVSQSGIKRLTEARPDVSVGPMPARSRLLW